MRTKDYYHIDIFIDNNWHRYSSHKNYESADDMGEVICKSKQCIGRMVLNGSIIREFDGLSKE